jgi:hypothetical protein
MDYNDLLIEILNMTPEERKQPVRFAEESVWASDTYKNVGSVCKNYGDLYLIEE